MFLIFLNFRSHRLMVQPPRFGFGFDFGVAERHSSDFMPGLMYPGVMSMAESKVDVSDLLCPEPNRFRLWRPQFSTCLSHPGSLDGAVEFSKYLELICPILV